MAADERELIAAVRAGDETAFAGVVAVHQPGLVRIARVWVKDSAAWSRRARSSSRCRSWRRRRVLEPDNPMGGFLMKDILLFGAALFTAAEALDAGAQHRAVLVAT